MSHDDLISTYRAAGQGHVFAHWDSLDETQRAALAAQAAEIDLAEVDSLNRALVVGGSAHRADLRGLSPAPSIRLPGNGGDPAEWSRARAAGEEALRAGRVSAFTVAGGQGTRLGYDGPKGTFRITPLKGKSLFQVFAEKIRAAGLRYGRPLHWFVMTSHSNHAETEAFFASHRYFGLDRSRVHFFRQGRMPAVSFEGKILLESKGSIAMSPDGHGGSLRALDRSGALDLMRREGIDTISYFQVDNPLVRAIDPAFIGFHLLRQSEMSSKMVPKAYPEEKVGHFCIKDGRLVVVEYSDMPAEMQRETNPDGSLRYSAGSIAIHIIDRDFAKRMACGNGAGKCAADKDAEAGSGGASCLEGEDSQALPFHRADKKIETIDSQGNPLKPTKANGVKFEMFVFDALPCARNAIVVETAREDDFSPVKNAEGVDSPQTARDDQLRQFARWIKSVGATIETEEKGIPGIKIEISPLFGYDRDSFSEHWERLPLKPDIKDGLYLE